MRPQPYARLLPENQRHNATAATPLRAAIKGPPAGGRPKAQVNGHQDQSSNSGNSEDHSQDPQDRVVAVRSKVLHRKRPKLIPLFDAHIYWCYTLRPDAPLPEQSGRSYAGYRAAWLRAVQKDLHSQLDQWKEIAAIAPDRKSHRCGPWTSSAGNSANAEGDFLRNVAGGAVSYMQSQD